MMANPDREMGLRDEDVEFPHVRARTMPAPPLEEGERVERKRRKRFVLQCIAVLFIGSALYWCFGSFVNRGIAALFGLRRYSWLRESLICSSLVLLPLVPITWRYFRRQTQTPRS